MEGVGRWSAKLPRKWLTGGIYAVFDHLLFLGGAHQVVTPDTRHFEVVTGPEIELIEHVEGNGDHC
jgi:hypothetical protein